MAQQSAADVGREVTSPEWLSAKSFTAILKVGEGRSEALKKALWAAGDSIGKRNDVPVGALDNLHFLRILVLDDHLGRYGDELMINATFDGQRALFLDAFCEQIGPWLWTLIQRDCVLAETTLSECLEANCLIENAVFASQLDGRREDVKKEACLMEALQNLADKQRKAGRWGSEASAEAIRQEMRQWVLDLKNADLPAGPRPKLALKAQVRRLWNGFCAIMDPFSGLLAESLRKRYLGTQGGGFSCKRLVMQVGLAGHHVYTYIPRRWLLAKVRRMEASEVYEPFAASAERLIEQQQREDLKTQNPLTLVAHVRETPARTWTFKQVLHGASSATRHLWNEGELAGISTIHYARLYQYGEGRRFLFLSDYDGSWARYLGDFLGVGALAVVPIFGHLRGCPMTEGLFHPTKNFAGRFLQFTRFSMCATQFWYSAWPELTVVDRLRNRNLRHGLFEEQMSEEAAREWLANLG